MSDDISDKEEPYMNRREVLKNTGLSVAGIAGIPTVSRATGRDRQKLIDQAFHILQKTGSIEKQHKFLRNHGFATSYNRQVYKMPVGSRSSEMGTLAYDVADLEIAISIFKDCLSSGVYTVEQEWTYHINDRTEEYGAIPVDITGIGWREGHWNFNSKDISETTYSTNYVSYRDGSQSEGPGIAFNMDDEQSFEDYNADKWHRFGVYLKPAGDHDPRDRIVTGSYTHTWASVGINGISIDYGGVSVDVSNDTNSWRTDTTRDGVMLRVNQSEATDDHCY